MLCAFIAVIYLFGTNQFWQQTRHLSPIKTNHKPIKLAALSVRWKYHSGALLCAAHSVPEQQCWTQWDHGAVLVRVYATLNTTDTLRTTASAVATGGAGAERACASFDKVKVTFTRLSAVLPLSDHVKYIRMKLPSQLDIIIIITKYILKMSVVRLQYLDPAATLEPLPLKVTCVALVVNRVRMPSGSPSGNVWICTVLLELAVTSLLFCGGKNTSQSTTDSCHVDSLRELPVERNHTFIYYESEVTNLECEGVHFFPNSDELWIVIIQTLPYPNISIISTGHKEPEEKCIITVKFRHYGASNKLIILGLI